MATAAANPLDSNLDTLSKLLGLFQKSGGGTTTTEESVAGGTTTKQLQLSPEALQYLTKQMMQAVPGLGAAPRAAGIYNSTTKNLLLNDLMARSAGELAARSAPEVTTAPAATKTTKQTAPVKEAAISPTTALLGAGAALAWKNRDKIKDIFSDVPLPTGDITGGMSLPGGMSTSSDWLGGFDTFTGGGSSMADVAADWYSGIDGGNAVSSALDFGGGGFDFGSIPISSAFNFLSGNNAGGNAGEDLVLGTIGNMIMPGVGGLIGTALNDIPVVSDVVNAAGDAVQQVWDTVTGGCFITTAVTAASGKPDDCYELQTLRQYRDTFVYHNYPEAVKQYYQEAPGIVAAIEKREDSARVFANLNRDYIVPAIAAIEAGDNDGAFLIYRKMFQVAKEISQND